MFPGPSIHKASQNVTGAHRLEKVQSTSKENVHKERRGHWTRDERKGSRELEGEGPPSKGGGKGRSSCWERRKCLFHGHSLSLTSCVTLGRPVMSLSTESPVFQLGESCPPVFLTGLC